MVRALSELDPTCIQPRPACLSLPALGSSQAAFQQFPAPQWPFPASRPLVIPTAYSIHSALLFLFSPGLAQAAVA